MAPAGARRQPLSHRAPPWVAVNVLTLARATVEILLAVDKPLTMVALTRLDGRGITIHASHIVTVESTPNTLLWLHNGVRLMVRESVAEVCDKVCAWSQRTACPWPAPDTSRGGEQD